MKQTIINFLKWCLNLLEVKTHENKTIKYRFLEILKNKGKSRRKDLINYILMAQNDVKKNLTTSYNSSLYKDVSRGYYATNLSKWWNVERLIKQDDDGLYFISSIGLEYLKNPKSLRYQNAKRRIDKLQRHLDWYKDNVDYSNNYKRAIDRSDNRIWTALEFYKIQGFREELTTDKRYYLDAMIDFIEHVVDHKDIIKNFGNKYKTDKEIGQLEAENLF